MSKYIIELDDRIKLVTSVGVTENGVVYTTSDYVHNLEELNSDYINENFGSLQDEAYQAGMDKAWELANDVLYDRGNILDILGCDTSTRALDGFTPREIIEKLKAYESKQKDRIEVGDEVDWNGDCFVVTRIYQPLIDKRCNGIAKDGSVYMDVVCDRLTKTGRHFDIASILEAMRE